MVKKTNQTKIDSFKHKDKRKNIPTKELRDFVVDDELSPKGILYPRDLSLDPQLVWKGKDEQDSQNLVVQAVPLYIQEKIHPQAVINDLPKIEQSKDNQLMLFSDFNGGPHDFDQKIDFYHHEQNWSNRLILGDSLLIMNSLAEKEKLKGKIQTIYFDPPYGIKFSSNWQVSTRKREVKERSDDITRQPEQVRAFRDTWKLGIHSYLAYLRDRLTVARDLLTESGSVFVQIGDENIHLVRCLLDEIFGSENFKSIITVKKTAGLASDSMPAVTDFVLWYAKNIELLKVRSLFVQKKLEDDTAYSFVQLTDGSRRRMTNEEHSGTCKLPLNAKIYRQQILLSAGRTESCIYSINYKGNAYNPTAGRSWATNQEGMKRLIEAGRIVESGTTLSYIRFANDFPVNPISNFWSDTASGSGMDKIYVVQTNTKIIERCILMNSDPGDLILDPTCGSGTTAYVAEQWGRRWITCDTSRVALALARTRLMTAKYPYYILADSHEGIEIEQKTTGKSIQANKISNDVRKGFLYKRVPHITLKSIANNPDIKKGMTQKEIDHAIARHANTEILYDKPLEDGKRVRVCGPFSVESYHHIEYFQPLMKTKMFLRAKKTHVNSKIL